MGRILETTARNLRFLREKRGWTQEEAARQYGVTVIQVAKYEKGINAPKIERLARIALLYGVSVDAILGLKRMIVTTEE
jgi:transcriptional regulator with XRE-family HTH domain